MSESFSRETIRQLIKQQQQGPEQTFADTERKLRQKIERLEVNLAKAIAGLEKCQEELYEYSRQEYPLDHPVHERYRQRDYDANTARATLSELKGESHE